MAFETIWNCRENIENKNDKRFILTVFEKNGTSEKKLKTRTLNAAF